MRFSNKYGLSKLRTMTKNLFLLLTACSIIFLVFSFTSDSYAQNPFPSNPEPSVYGMTILVQTFVHNSEGKLVTYLASDKFSMLNVEALSILLDAEESENDPIITIEEEKFQVIKRRVTIPYERENVIASTIIAHSTNGTLNMVARFAHDGYPLIPGDKVTTIWTFLRPHE